MKLSIVIPVYNEAATVRTLLEKVWAQPISIDKELIIVESNSKDGSREIIQTWAKEASLSQTSNTLKLILQEKGLGKGNAVREGLASATGDIVLIQDGDLEYDVADYPALISPILEGKADFVLGSRHLSAGTWKVRKFEKDPMRSGALNIGGVLFHLFFNFVYQTELTDPTTMYKVFRRKCIEKLKLESDRFDFDFELLGKLIRAGFPPLEIPISYTSRGFEEGKKIRVFRDPFTWVWAILRFRFGSIYKN